MIKFHAEFGGGALAVGGCGPQNWEGVRGCRV